MFTNRLIHVYLVSDTNSLRIWQFTQEVLTLISLRWATEITLTNKHQPHIRLINQSSNQMHFFSQSLSLWETVLSETNTFCVAFLASLYFCTHIQIHVEEDMYMHAEHTLSQFQLFSDKHLFLKLWSWEGLKTYIYLYLPPRSLNHKRCDSVD